MTEPGLDFAFLQYIGATPESQKAVQRFYVPQFAGCTRVLDLGCGSGDFLELLAARGIAGLGVDADPRCCADARTRGVAVVEQDVLGFLRAAAPAEFDGVFCAHLVEHLPYESVLELLRGIRHVLRPGGRVVLVTPNARSLFAHLEMYPMHFGHVSFYHPRLLEFFLQHTGFERVVTGVNDSLGAAAVWGNLHWRRAGDAPARAASLGPVRFNRSLPMPSDNVLRRAMRRVKNYLAQWFVLPYLDEIVPQTNARLAALAAAGVELDQARAGLVGALERLDPPWECYALAYKPAETAEPGA